MKGKKPGSKLVRGKVAVVAPRWHPGEIRVQVRLAKSRLGADVSEETDECTEKTSGCSLRDVFACITSCHGENTLSALDAKQKTKSAARLRNLSNIFRKLELQ